MTLELRQLHPLFAAEANGADLSRPIDAPMVDAIWQAIDRYAVIVFRDQ
jgi:alpha-ketoglutarate-dependent 2,4-dichlorophenoxyacetate dioxygenase